MASGERGIGIDLGTTKVMIYKEDEGIVVNEPSVVAYDAESGEPIAFGQQAYEMVGKTHKNIVAEYPLKDGVISNYTLTKEMVKYFIGKAYNSKIVKPKVSICVPSAVTGIEENAVVDAAVSSGARQVLIIEEPIAAAIGAGIDIVEANGNIIVDIGGGTTDIAVISLGGIVCSKSIKLAGNAIDREIIKLLKNKYGFLVGQKTAQMLKHEVADCMPTEENNRCFEVKGINLFKGLPGKLNVYTKDIQPIIDPIVDEYIMAVKNVLEITPPELSGDIYENGILLTGAGARLANLDKRLEQALSCKVSVAENCEQCVAIGTGKAFDLALKGKLESGFRDVTPGISKK
ncbi:MAG: rod shape-determining protein [Oscillospiraceae bacterium]|nr:rod shape-determining protein [Oscillospiraceae bacterium]